MPNFLVLGSWRNHLDLNEFQPARPLTLEFIHSDGSKDFIVANHTYNETQIDWFKAGSALNLIKKMESNYCSLT